LDKYSFYDLCQFRKHLCQVELDEFYRLMSNSTTFIERVGQKPGIQDFGILCLGKYSFYHLYQFRKHLCQVELDELYRLMSNSTTFIEWVGQKPCRQDFGILCLGKYSFYHLCQFRKHLYQVELDELYRLMSNSTTFIERVGQKPGIQDFGILFFGKYSFYDLCQFRERLCQVVVDELYRLMSNSTTFIEWVGQKPGIQDFGILCLGKYSFYDLCQFRKRLCQVQLNGLYRLISNSILFTSMIDLYAEFKTANIGDFHKFNSGMFVLK
jgi:hypothetical protein